LNRKLIKPRIRRQKYMWELLRNLIKKAKSIMKKTTVTAPNYPNQPNQPKLPN